MPDMVKSINQIFADQVFHVPDYQRGYAWEERQWDDLLEDLELLPERRNHFTGTLVLRARNSGNEQILDKYMQAYKAYDIIDGQQRLTTVVILLKAIHDEMLKLPRFAPMTEHLQKTYLYTEDMNGQPFTKLVLNADCQDFFADNVLGLRPGITGPTIRSHERLLGAQFHLTKYLKERRDNLKEAYTDWLQKLYGKVTLQLNLIVYPVEDELDAGTIFETMNDRGKPLTELEKVKNFLLYLSGKLDLPAPHDLSRRINETWKFINERLMAAGLAGRVNEDQLLRAHWLMAYDYDVKRWENARSIKAHFSLKEYRDRHDELLEDLKAYLQSLHDATAAYCDIYQPKHPVAFNDIVDLDVRAQLKLWGEKISRLGVSASFLPLLIAVRLKSDDGGNIYLETLQLLEKFSFRVFSWRKARANAGQTSLFQYGNRFFHNPEAGWMTNAVARLILFYCPDESFNERFNREEENWFRWGDISYFLYEYEHHLAGGRPVQLTWETLNARPKASSIEHILPQTPDVAYWQEHFSLEQIKRWTNDLGNLTLTYDNSSLWKHAFPEKKGKPGQKGTYADSPLFIERTLASCNDWDESRIIQRREVFRKWATERWRVEPPSGNAEDGLPEKFTMERILTLADQRDVGDELRSILDTMQSHGIFPAPRIWCVMLAPPRNHLVALMTIWPKVGKLHVGLWHENWPKHLNVTEQDVKDAMGDEIWRYLDSANLDEFVHGLETLFVKLAEDQ